MAIEQRIDLCRFRITYLNGVRASALRTGDVEQVGTIDAQISVTQTTLNQLLTLA